jgi:hypothetical protein
VAVYANRTRLGSGAGRQAMRRRAEIVEHSFAHNLDRGGMRRTWLRGCENVHKRDLVHVAGHNLGILMRLLIGAGTPREAAARALAYLCFVGTEKAAAPEALVNSAGYPGNRNLDRPLGFAAPVPDHERGVENAPVAYCNLSLSKGPATQGDGSQRSVRAASGRNPRRVRCTPTS